MTDELIRFFGRVIIEKIVSPIATPYIEAVEQSVSIAGKEIVDNIAVPLAKNVAKGAVNIAGKAKDGVVYLAEKSMDGASYLAEKQRMALHILLKNQWMCFISR